MVRICCALFWMPAESQNICCSTNRRCRMQKSSLCGSSAPACRKPNSTTHLFAQLSELKTPNGLLALIDIPSARMDAGTQPVRVAAGRHSRSRQSWIHPAFGGGCGLRCCVPVTRMCRCVVAQGVARRNGRAFCIEYSGIGRPARGRSRIHRQDHGGFPAGRQILLRLATCVENSPLPSAMKEQVCPRPC